MLTCWFLIPFFLYAQKGLTLDQQRLAASPYVYKLTVLNGKSPVGTMTAFKIEGYDGLLTALHGLTVPSVEWDRLNFVAKRFSEEDDGRRKAIIRAGNLELRGIYKDADLAFITYKSTVKDRIWTQSEGLKLAESQVQGGELVRVLGYQGIDVLIGRDRTTEAPVLYELGRLVTPETYAKLNGRKSPALNQTVINLGPTAIFSGDSGGPIFNRQGEVVGVANGGDYNRRDRLRSWAVLPKDIPIKKTDEQKISFRELSTAGLQVLMSEPNPVNHAYKDNETPRWTFGLTLSRPMWFSNAGVKLGGYNELNASFDAYVETRLRERTLGGVYVSSRYLQYRLVQEFSHNLPLPPGERRQHTGPTVNLFGFQLSRLISQGVVHNAYAGIGGLFIPGQDEKTRLLNNARIFTGYRLYLGPQRNFGLELRASWIHQNIVQTRLYPRLGIGQFVREIKPLDQWYLCGGLTYSIYRRERPE